ncbi:MAG: ArnT family glycosyltransferase [Anaerolineae bacterium]|jgi:4-amino-4-deoxy-L-arabinose transferase-like glycosyltransferase
MDSGLGKSLRQHSTIALILAAFVALGMIYQHTTPIFETPDEPDHYLYSQYITEHKQLPPPAPSGKGWGYGELHQPPLYYLMGALLMPEGLDGDDVNALYPRNAFAAVGYPKARGNRNATLHPSEDSPTLTMLTRSVRRLRGLSLVLSAGTVLLTYLIARRAVPRDRRIALGAAAVTAFTPQFLFIGASINNDATVTFFSTLALYVAMSVVTGNRHNVRTPLLLGVVVGLATLSKLSGLAAAALAPAAYGLVYIQKPDRRVWPDLIHPVLLATVATLVTGGWWYLRNTLQYQDPLALNAYHSVFSMGYDTPMSIRKTLTIALGALPSYWGVFGWLNILAGEWFYVLVRVIMLLGVLGLIVRGARRIKKPAGEYLPGVVLVAIWAALVLGMNLYFIRSAGHTQGRLAFPGISALSSLLAMGLLAPLPDGRRGIGVAIMSVGLGVVALIMPYAYIAPAYNPPPRIAPADLPESMHPVEITYYDSGGNDLITLRGYEILTPELFPGDELHLRLYWQAHTPPEQNYVLGIQLVNPDERRVGGLDTHPGMGLYPTSRWKPGEVLVDDYFVPVSDQVEGPIAAALRVGLYQDVHDNLLPPRDYLGRDLSPATHITRVRIAAAAPIRHKPAHPLAVQFDDRVILTGYDLVPDAGSDGLGLTLYWECLAPLNHPYTVFVHLVDESGAVLAQADGQPMGNSFPTTYWQPGDRIRDERTISLDDIRIMPDSIFRLLVGFYDEADRRLPVTSDHAASQATADAAIIGPFHISSQGIVSDDATR